MQNSGSFFAPTLLKDVPETARIMTEEPFGPVAPTTRFSTLDEVIERANSLSVRAGSLRLHKQCWHCRHSEAGDRDWYACG